MHNQRLFGPRFLPLPSPVTIDFASGVTWVTMTSTHLFPQEAPS
jgi:hypothetical protein